MPRPSLLLIVTLALQVALLSLFVRDSIEDDASALRWALFSGFTVLWLLGARWQIREDRRRRADEI